MFYIFSPMDNNQILLQLSATEQRVLGVLVEKSKTTPDYYPMTISALTNACNQKTSRNPVVDYDEETVTLTLNTLKIKGLVSTATGGSSRAIKYKHNLAIVYPLLPSELAVLCLLLLRGPLTPGEINSNSARLYEFETIEEVQEIMQKLAADSPAYTIQLPKKAGQKEARYQHLFGGEVQEEEVTVTATIAAAPDSQALELRVSKLEEELAEVKEMLNLLLN